MKVRVLGCSGSIAKNNRTTAFLVDGHLLVDAGTGVGDLTLDEMEAITDVVLTHAHLDHVAALPLMLDSIGARLSAPMRVHALPGTIDALRAHLFNNVLWPDFSRIPSVEAPFLTFHEIQVGQVLDIRGKQVEVMPAVHTVPACGYAISAGGPAWVFTGDTERNPAFWERLNRMDVGALVIETAFSSREKDLARLSRHLSPEVLAQELDQIDPSKDFPIYITHTKPAETDLIMVEVRSFDRLVPQGAKLSHDIRWIRAGVVIQVGPGDAQTGAE